MKYLRQSTATTIIIGPFVNFLDGVTPKTTLTDQSANGRLVKNGTGGTITVSSWAHDAAGSYVIGLTTGHTDTLGRLRVEFNDATTFLPVWEDFSVLSQAVYDTLFGTVALNTVVGYATGQDPATLLLATPANKLATDGTGRVTAGTVSDKTGYALDLTQMLSVSPTAGTLGQALAAALGSAIGKITYTPPTANPGTGSIQVFARDGTTSLANQTVTTDAAGNVVSRA